MDRRGVRKIFVRGPNWVGDFVMASGAFERIRQAFPAAHITLGARSHLFGLTSGSAWFDDFLPTPKAKSLGGLWAQAKALRERKFDLAIVLPNSPATGLPPWLARIPLRLGYRQGRPGLMNLGLTAARNRRWFERRGPRRVPEPMPTYYERLLDVLEIPPGRPGTILHVTDGERSEIEAWLRDRGFDDGRRIVLLTAGAAYGASKLWEPAKFVELAKRLTQRGDIAVFLAGPAEVEMAESLAREVAHPSCVAATDPVLPLTSLKALVSRSAAMVTTDTGPRHISVAFDKPTVCLIGPSDPRYTDYSLARTELIRKDIPCSPCQRKVCPLGHQNCMKWITVDETVAALDRLFDRVR